MQPPRHSNLHGILAMVAALGVFILGDSASKFALAEVPMFEAIAIRSYAGMVLGLILVVLMGYGKDLARALNPWVVARGFAEVGANFAFTIALIRMPIADITAIIQTAPLLVLLGAWLFYGERLSAMRLVLIGLGFVGALLVAQPGTTAASPYAVLGFLVAFAAAGRDLMTRKVPRSVPAPVAAFAVICCLFVTSFTAMLASETPVVPSLRDFSLLFMAGAALVAGHLGVFLAYKLSEARTVAPFMYSLTIWAVLSGLLLFGDRPNAIAVAGMALIVGAGLMVIHLDGRRRARLSQPEIKAGAGGA